MIRIGKPYIEQTEDKVYLKAFIEDEYQNIREEIYYSTSSEYGEFFCEEVADAFVVGMLLPAVRYRQDIIVEGDVSSRLYYNIINSISFLLSHIWGGESKYRFTLKSGVRSINYNSNAVGCGCSLGVDSFAAMLQHTSATCPSDYRITHLTYFNVGAMGYVNLEKAKESYQKDLKMVQNYANKLDLPVLCLESNFSIMYKDFDFDQSGEVRNFSAVLSLQKLFKRYLYASSFPITNFRYEQSNPAYYEALLAPLLSTDSCQLVIANPDMSRVDKTMYIISNQDVQKSLYVCWKELLANKYPNSEIARIKDNFLNCTRCGKCLRTILAIDILGQINDFIEIFDVEYYLRYRDAYIAKVIYLRKNNVLYRELCELMKKRNYRISLKTRFLVFLYRIKVIQIINYIKKS